MDVELRRLYNAAYTPALYDRYRTQLEAEVGPTFFRLAETPLFLPTDLRDELYRSTAEIIAELAVPETLEFMRPGVPERLRTPRMDHLPSVMTCDFAVVRGDDGRLHGRVVELQAFPSIYAYTLVQGRVWREVLADAIPGLDMPLSPFAPGVDYAHALALFRHAILGPRDPEEVVLVDILPEGQKTRADFAATKKLIGVDTECVTRIRKEGRKLYREKDGRVLPIERIYHRVVFDELEKRKPEMAWSFADDLEVEWVPHPNWYFAWSKASLPYLKHPAIPRAWRISELPAIPDELAGYVLKPLFSFAGAGVIVDPTATDIAAIPDDQRHNWILQEKITYARDLLTPDGHGVAAEIRILCLRPDGEALPKPFMNLVRLSRGKMLGIDFNKDLEWVGSTVGLCGG